jgi:hypothetical protein
MSSMSSLVKGCHPCPLLTSDGPCSRMCGYEAFLGQKLLDDYDAFTLEKTIQGIVKKYWPMKYGCLHAWCCMVLGRCNACAT